MAIQELALADYRHIFHYVPIYNKFRIADFWEIVSSAEEAHDLLVSSDRAAAIGGGHLPTRNPQGTAWLVHRGAVHGLRRDGRLVATVTVTAEPTFTPNADCIAALRPLYMRRLSVAPDAEDPLLGYRAVRYAIAYAHSDGHDVLRSEVNPDLGGVSAMLRSLGFRQCGPTAVAGGVPTAQMKLLLAGGDHIG